MSSARPASRTARRWRPASSVGRRGERIAARYLRRRGYRVMARNMRVGPGEADIVCVAPDRQTLVIVEVKARQASSGERRPESAVGHTKQSKLRLVAEAARKQLGAQHRPIRIDVIAVEIKPWPKRSAVRHIERAVNWTGRP